MPLAARPFLSFMLDWAHGHGVDEVTLSCGFLSDGVKRVLGDIYDGMRLRYVVEEEPLGTAGPVRLAHDEGVLGGRPFRPDAARRAGSGSPMTRVSSRSACSC